MRNKDFYKGIKLALIEKGWQKYIKIPKSEIIAYVYLMDYFGVKGRKTILRHFTPTQKRNFYRKKKASYSYILTFQLLQDLRRSRKIKDLFSRWHLKKNDYLKASKMLSGLLKQHANKKVKDGIQGAYALDVLDILRFFTAPKLEAKFAVDVLELSVGKLATGISLFFTPIKLGDPKIPDIPGFKNPFIPVIPGKPQVKPKPEVKPEVKPTVKPKPEAIPKVDAPPMDFTDEDAKKLEKELEEEENKKNKKPKTNPNEKPKIRPVPFKMGGFGSLLPLVGLYFLLSSGKKKKK